jgi:hypothetical protein
MYVSSETVAIFAAFICNSLEYNHSKNSF